MAWHAIIILRHHTIVTITIIIEDILFIMLLVATYENLSRKKQKVLFKLSRSVMQMYSTASLMKTYTPFLSPTIKAFILIRVHLTLCNYMYHLHVIQNDTLFRYDIIIVNSYWSYELISELIIQATPIAFLILCRHEDWNSFPLSNTCFIVLFG